MLVANKMDLNACISLSIICLMRIFCISVLILDLHGFLHADHLAASPTTLESCWADLTCITQSETFSAFKPLANRVLIKNARGSATEGKHYRRDRFKGPFKSGSCGLSRAEIRSSR